MRIIKAKFHVYKKGGTCRMAPVASTFSLICREMVYAKHTQNVG